MLSAGNINDMTMAADLIEAAAGRFDRLIADRGYDTNAIRAAIAAQAAEVVIPSTTTRRAPIPYDRDAYRLRNLVERLWCRLKDWRRIATATTNSPETSSQQPSSLQPSSTGAIESGP